MRSGQLRKWVRLLCYSSVSSHDKYRCHVTLQGSVQVRETFNIQHMDFINEEYLERDRVIMTYNFTKILVGCMLMFI